MILAKKTPPRGVAARGEKGVPAVTTRGGRGWREAHPVMSAIARGYERPGKGHRSEGEPPEGACRRRVWVARRLHPHFVADSSWRRRTARNRSQVLNRKKDKRAKVYEQPGRQQ